MLASSPLPLTRHCYHQTLSRYFFSNPSPQHDKDLVVSNCKNNVLGSRVVPKQQHSLLITAQRRNANMKYTWYKTCNKKEIKDIVSHGFGRGHHRTEKSDEEPLRGSSPWMPFLTLISMLSKVLPPCDIALISKFYKD
ncbi:inactive poly of ADP-ribose polymerase SRO5 isoform X1 [Spatholobus suberectus]|nr:inactive poly of ADP-ribose polymerase SRO5 isoform X1 [Spatholobus suberectus]